MFSYRHAFHAGNHADVLKHTVLIQLLDYMTQKDKPVMIVDTHAGAGLYKLDEGHAAKSGESASGIDKLWVLDDLPEPLGRYIEVVQGFNEDDVLRFYPGSPWIAARVARDEDLIRVFELHPTDVGLLEDNVLAMNEGATGHTRRVMMKADDGFAGAKAFMPPPSRRALVIIDPPYEDKNDYARVVTCVQDILQRLPGAVIAVWYPVLPRMESKDMPRKLSRLPAKNWLNITLNVGKSDELAMNLAESGMFILNPPFNLREQLKPVLPYLLKHLKQGPNAAFKVEEGTPKKPLEHTPRIRKAFGPPRAGEAPGRPRSSGPRGAAGSVAGKGPRPRPAPGSRGGRT